MEQSQVSTGKKPRILQVSNQQQLQLNRIWNAIRYTAYVQLACAIACVVLEIIFLAAQSSFPENEKVVDESCSFPISAGIWTGFAYFSAGMLGMYADKIGNRCLAISYLVMSIICSLLAAVGISMAVLGTAITWECFVWANPKVTNSYNLFADFDICRKIGIESSTMPIRLPAVILCMFQIIELVTSTVATVFCCLGLCPFCQVNTPQHPVYPLPDKGAGKATNVVSVPSQQQQPAYPSAHGQQQQQPPQQFYPGVMQQHPAFNLNHPPAEDFTPDASEADTGYCNSAYTESNPDTTAPD